MGSRIQTWRPKTFHLNKDHRSRSHQYFHLIDLLHSQLVSYHAIVKGKFFCNVTSDLLWTMIMTREPVMNWRKSLGSRSHRRNCWGVTDCLFDFVKVCSSAWMFAIETSRSSGLIDSGLFFHKLWVTHYPPPNSAVLMSAFDQIQSSMLSLNFTVYRVECFSGLEGPLWFATRGGS